MLDMAGASLRSRLRRFASCKESTRRSEASNPHRHLGGANPEVERGRGPVVPHCPSAPWSGTTRTDEIGFGPTVRLMLPAKHAYAQ